MGPGMPGAGGGQRLRDTEWKQGTLHPSAMHGGASSSSDEQFTDLLLLSPQSEAACRPSRGGGAGRPLTWPRDGGGAPTSAPPEAAGCRAVRLLVRWPVENAAGSRGRHMGVQQGGHAGGWSKAAGVARPSLLEAAMPAALDCALCRGMPFMRAALFAVQLAGRPAGRQAAQLAGSTVVTVVTVVTDCCTVQQQLAPHLPTHPEFGSRAAPLLTSSGAAAAALGATQLWPWLAAPAPPPQARWPPCTSGWAWLTRRQRQGRGAGAAGAALVVRGCQKEDQGAVGAASSPWHARVMTLGH